MVATEDRPGFKLPTSFLPKHPDGTICHAMNPLTCPKNPLNQAKIRANQAKMFQGQRDNQWMRQQYDAGASVDSINRWRKGGEVPDADDPNTSFEYFSGSERTKTPKEIAQTPRWQRKLYDSKGNLPTRSIFRPVTSEKPTKAIKQANKFDGSK